jgi:DNA end-binding protein Ku
MRSLWRGSVSFGLVNIPVRLYAATEKQDIKFRYLHKECLTPIEYEKRCPTCRREVAADEIVWGYEYEKGRFVVLDEEDFDRLPLHTELFPLTESLVGAKVPRVKENKFLPGGA